MPALPLDESGPYVAAAYLVFLGLVLLYVAIMASKLARLGKQIEELSALAEEAPDGELRAGRAREPA